MSLQRSTIQELVTELKSRQIKGFSVESSTENSLYFDINSDMGAFRSYAIESSGTDDEEKWEVNQKVVWFDNDGESKDKDCILGTFASASQIADEILEAEEDIA